MERIIGAGLIAILSFFLSSTALAGGYEIGTDNGPESVARAGATTANPSFTSLYTNVAGLADVDFVELYLGNNFNFRHVWFQRAAFEGRDWDPIEDEGAMDIGPMLALHFRVADWLTLAIGVNGPTSIVGGDFPAGTVEHDNNPDNNLSGASRFDMTHSEVLLLWPSIAAGFRFRSFPNLRIGVSFQPAFAYMWFTTYAETTISVLGEAETELAVSDPFIPAGQIGFLYRVNGFERLEFGLQFRFSDHIKAEGEVVPSIHARSEEQVERPAADATFEAPFPPMVMRFGMRYAHPREGAPESALYNFERELFDIELDVVYEMNSAVDEYNVSIQNVSLDDALPNIDRIDIALDHSWKDTVSLRLGSSVNLLRGHLTISAGFSWESNTVPESHTRVDYLGWERFGLGAGIIGRFWIMELALTYQHIFMPDRSVTPGTGQVYAAVATANAAETISDTVVNEGDYQASYDVVGFSIGFRFERPNRSRGDDEEPIEETAATEPLPEPDESPSEAEPAPEDSSAEEMPLDAI